MDLVNTAMLFRYKGRLVNSQQKCPFFLYSLHFCLPFYFVFIRMRSWESWNFMILSIKIRVHRLQYTSYKLQTIDILTWYFDSKVVNIRFHKYFIKSSSKQNVILKNEKQHKLNIKFTISPKYEIFASGYNQSTQVSYSILKEFTS